LKGKATLTPGN